MADEEEWRKEVYKQLDDIGTMLLIILLAMLVLLGTADYLLYRIWNLFPH